MTHPLTPPDELLEHWCAVGKLGNWQNALTLAYRAGADQELEACCGELPYFANELRAARRPKPPSLKELLLQKLEHIRDVADKYQSTQNAIDDLRETLEALND